MTNLPKIPMASSLSRTLYHKLLQNTAIAKPTNFSSSVCSKRLFSSESSSFDSDSSSDHPVSEPEPAIKSEPEPTNKFRSFAERPLENGLDVGIYKAILVGRAGQTPIEKKLKGGRIVTLLTVGTGGIRNNRKPMDNEDPKEYANRCSVQWHRVSIYPERLGKLAAKNVVAGSLLYLEGNLETKIFTDPITGLVRRLREVAIRRNGRLVFLGDDADGDEESSKADMRRAGFY